MREYVGCPRSPHEVAFVPGDPPRLVAAANMAAYVWQPTRPDPVEYPWDETAWGQPLMTVSPDGRWLVAGPGGRLRAWDLAAGRPGPPVALPIGGDGGELAIGFTGRPARFTAVRLGMGESGPAILTGDVRVGGAGRGRPRQSTALPLPAELQTGAQGIRTEAQSGALSGDGRVLALCASRQAAHVWDLAGGGPPRAVALRGVARAVSLSPDGSRLAVDAGTTVYVHDAATLEVIAKWKAKHSYYPRLAWSPDGRLVARTDRSTTVRVHDAVTGREVVAVGGKRGALISVAFSPDGLTIATGTEPGPVRVWDVG